MIDPRGRLYVCWIHRENSDRMIPISKSMSIIQVFNSLKSQATGVEIFEEVNEEIHFLKRVRTVPFRKVYNSDDLFVVQFLKWEDEFPRPLGIVTRRLPKGDTQKRALKILYTEYGVQENFPQGLESEVKETQARSPLKEERQRPRVVGAFTIDPPGSEDLDDALTVEPTSDGNWKVGIHIADVSFYVEEGSAVDKEARKRCTSYYPGGDRKCIPMLPEELSTQLCSLLPDQDRLTVSMSLVINKNGEVHGKAAFQRTVTHSSCRLTYREAQQIIFNKGCPRVPEDVVSSILILHKLATMRRKLRLGDAALSPSEDSDGDPEAHQLVEEMMILANQVAAQLLKEKSPEAALLRTQLPPKFHRLRQWREAYGHFAKYSLSLKKHIPEGLEISPCERFVISTSTWSNMVDAARRGDHRKLCHLICNDRNHPQLSVARAHFSKIQAKAEYFCTGAPESDQQGVHFSMESEYTHFTSPIRRYFDIMVHRQILSLCNSGVVSCQDGAKELAVTCRRCTFFSGNANNFEKECKKVHFADKLKTASSEIMAYVSVLEEGAIQLQEASPHKDDLLTGKQAKIQISRLGPIKQPQCDDMNRATLLEWRLRVYLAPRPCANDIESDAAKIRKILSLGHHNCSFEVPGERWDKILELVKLEGDKQGLIDEILEVDNDVQTGTVTTEDRTPFRQGTDDADLHFFSKSLQLTIGGVVMVQLAPRMIRGLLTPDIQLFKLAPEMSICLEHRSHATHCFAATIPQEASRKNYTSPSEYVEAWKPVIASEAARTAVEDDDVFIILGLKVSWNWDAEGRHSGSFELSEEYRNGRQIDFSVGDLVCARAAYQTNIETNIDEDGTGLPGRLRKQKASQKKCWVGHCIIQDKVEERVEIRLHQNSCTIPEEILANPVKCDCEFIRRSVPHR